MQEADRKHSAVLDSYYRVCAGMPNTRGNRVGLKAHVIQWSKQTLGIPTSSHC